MAASLPRELERLDLPVNFSFGVTRDGRIFFIDDRIQATSWLHPLTGRPIQTGHKSVQGLPIGWEQAVTPEGAVYYIDHNSRATTFEHPVTGRTANHVLPPPPTRSPPQSPVQSPSPKKSPSKQRPLKAPSASRDDSSMVTMRGWLYRQESGIKPWKKRWCVLADFGLFVYKDDKEHNSIGSILLPSYRIHQCTPSDTHRKFAFKTEHDNMKTYLFASDNQDDMNRWINALKLAAMLKGPPIKEKEKNNNTTKLIPKSAFMEWEDVGTDALAKVGRAQQQGQGQAPSPHQQLPRQGQPHYPPQNQPHHGDISQNSQSAFDPYQGRYPDNSDNSRHIPQNEQRATHLPQRNAYDSQDPDASYERDPRYRHPSGYDPHYNPQDRDVSGYDPCHHEHYDQGRDLPKHPVAHDSESRDPRHTHSDPRQQHPSGYDPRNQDPYYREQDGFDPRNQHPSGYHDPYKQGGHLDRNRDRSPQDPYNRHSRHDPQGRQMEDDRYRHFDPNESRRSDLHDETDGRFNPQSNSHDPRRSEMEPPYSRPHKSGTDPRRSEMEPPYARPHKSGTDPRRSEMEPPYARPHKSSTDPRKHHRKENGYIPGVEREQATLRNSRPDLESQHTDRRRYPDHDSQGKPIDQRYPEYDRKIPDNQNRGRTHTDDDPYIQMRPTDRDIKKDGDQKRSSVQKLQDWQRQELDRHRYGVPAKSDIVTPRSHDQSQNSEFFGYYSPKREAMERQRSNNLNDSRNSETFQKELHSDEPEDGYSTLTKYQTRDSLRPQYQQSHQSQPRSEDSRTRSDSSSPKRNPDLMIDVGHTYVNFPRDPSLDIKNEIPNRPPLPTAVRQQIVEELAQTKTPHTSKELIDAERALEKRMQQPSYFEYPTPSEPNKTFLQGQQSTQSDPHGYRYGDGYNDPRQQDRQNYHDKMPYQDQNVSRSLFGHPPPSQIDQDLRMIDHHQQDPYSDRRHEKYSDRQQNQYGENQRDPYGDTRQRYDPSNDKLSESKSEKIGKPESSVYRNKGDDKLSGSKLSSPKSSSTASSQPLKSSSSDVYRRSAADRLKGPSNSNVDQRPLERKKQTTETELKTLTGVKNIPTSKVETEKGQENLQGLDRNSSISLGLSNQSFESSEERRSAFRPLQSRSKDDLPTKHPDPKGESRYVPFPGSVAKGDKDQTDVKKRLSTASSQSQGHAYGDEGQRTGDNRRDKGKPKGLGTIHTVKEDPDMPDSDIIETTEIPQLGNKYPGLSGQRLRMSICASDLIGKTHDELVLMLIQLRREYTSLEKELNFYREKLEQKRPTEHQYRRMRQESDGPFSEAVEMEHRQYKELKYQCEEVSKKLEVFRPIVNLVHNMVNMGSLYGGDNFMLASQYRKHLLSPDEITPPKKMLEFSRKHQEEQMVKGIKEDIRQLTSDEVDLEDKLERLYELDRLIQEQSFSVTSLQEDRDLLDKALQGILRQQDMNRDNPRELDKLIYQQRTVEKELSKVMHQLAQASKELEETTAENNKIEHEVALLRSKVNDDLTRSKSAPSLSDENIRTKMMMEKDLAKVQNIMAGLNQQGARLSEAMNTLRRSSAGASLGAALDKADYRQQREKSTYMETDVDTSESKDLAQVTEILQSYQSQRSLASNDPREEQLSPTVTVGVSSKPVSNPMHQPMLDTELSTDDIEGDVQDGPWDIGDADDNTKRFFGIIPKEKPKLLTVRDVKRQSEQRKERDKLRRDDWNYDGENDQDEDQGYGTGGSSKYSDGNHPIYENLPPERKSSSWQSIQPSKSKTSSSQPRRSSLLHLVTPRPFVPFNSQNAAPSSLSNSSSMNLGYNSLSSPGADDGVVKATRVIIQPAFASDNIVSDNTNDVMDYTPKGWSPVKTGLFNVKRTPQGRYMTISSSEPVKLETSLIQPATLHSSAGDLIPGNTMDIPDIVKSSTTKMDQIDDDTIEREILSVPEKVYIPERYMPDSDEEDISEDERQRRQEKSEKIKRILTQQSVHSLSQPDVSKVADQVHQQVQQEKIKRAQLLEVSQELARQVTIKSRQAAAERRKTWSGSPSKKSEDTITNQIIQNTDLHDTNYEHDGQIVSENMYI